MAGILCFGAVVKWLDFQFADGGSSDKLLVILGCKPGKSLLAVLTTTKGRGRPKAPGCQAEHEDGAFYFFPGGMKNCFREDTWVELYRPQEASAAAFASLVQDGKIHVVFNLDKGVAAGLRNCLKRSPDTSDHHMSLAE